MVLSCYGRLVNDAREDTKIDAKLEIRGRKLYAVALEDVMVRDEIFVAYGAVYWGETGDDHAD